MWVAPYKLASAPHSATFRGGTDGCPAAASSEPPGLCRPQKSHPPASRDGSAALGRMSQMADGWNPSCSLCARWEEGP